MRFKPVKRSKTHEKEIKNLKLKIKNCDFNLQLIAHR
jgi:hypothetical protein